jgi:hypothetical protein
MRFHFFSKDVAAVAKPSAQLNFVSIPRLQAGPTDSGLVNQTILPLCSPRLTVFFQSFMRWAESDSSVLQ